jgi:hypothetical protein
LSKRVFGITEITQNRLPKKNLLKHMHIMTDLIIYVLGLKNFFSCLIIEKTDKL